MPVQPGGARPTLLAARRRLQPAQQPTAKETHPRQLKITSQEVIHQLAETKPIGIGSLNADAGGMRGRNPDAPANQPEHHYRQQNPTKFGFASGS
jgi:hypothetical protein